MHPQQVFTTFLQEEPTLKPPSLNLANTSLHIVMLYSLIHTLFGPSTLFNQNFDSCFDRMIQVIGTRLSVDVLCRQQIKLFQVVS